MLEICDALDIYGDSGDVAKLLSTLKDNLRTIDSDSLQAQLDAIVSNLNDTTPLQKYNDDIKSILDPFVSQNRVLSIFDTKLDDAQLDTDFYFAFGDSFAVTNKIIKLYNMARNHLTKKPYSDDKIKINFGNASLLNGWDKNKEPDRYSIILRKFDDARQDYNYYLGIMHADKNQMFAVHDDQDKSNFGKPKEDYSYDKARYDDSADCYQKMEYKFIPSNSTDCITTKFAFNPEYINKTRSQYLDDDATDAMQAITRYKQDKDKDTFKKWYSDDKKSNKDRWIGVAQKFLKDYYKHINWQFEENCQYNTYKDFCACVAEQGYSVSFGDIAKDFVDDVVDKGDLYLFQIYNKDFSPYSNGKGMPNLHTMYFRALFGQKNLDNSFFQLCGGGEIFWRKASIERKITHPKQQPIANKRQGYSKASSTFDYDLIKDKRFSQDKFAFHFPIKLNYINKNIKTLSPDINQVISNDSGDINIIGIDRGERHLLYVVLINQQGDIIRQFSLNEIVTELGQNKVVTNYRTLLDIKEKERTQQRQNWGTIENIKELKKGYLSLVVPIVTELAIQHNAIIVMENLNSGFKNSRKKFEKQVYQNFEKALLDKLSYYVKKDKYNQDGVLDGLQLTNKFESFEKLRGQSGIVCWVNPMYTSNICPLTGYVPKHIKYESREKTIKELAKFESIRYNTQKEWFEFLKSIDYSPKNTSKNKKTQNIPAKLWTICSFGDRIVKQKNGKTWSGEYIQPTRALQELFDNYQIDYKGGACIKDSITKTIKQDIDFAKRFVFLLSTTMQLRNSMPNSTDYTQDYILSPVADTQGVFFDSRQFVGIDDAVLPQNSDANGAYHIALKGKLCIDNIKCSGGKFTSPDLKQWLEYRQK